MSKMTTMYGENKPSTLINDTRCGLNFVPENPVRSAMPNKAPVTGESVCVVSVLACGGVCVVRPFPGDRHNHAARRA